MCLIVCVCVHVCVPVSIHRDGIPPYRYRKHQRKEMHESAKANGRVPLPHIPVSSKRCNSFSLIDPITGVCCITAKDSHADLI